MEVFQLCGGISDLPTYEAWENFNNAEKELRAKYPNAVIVHPLRLCDHLTISFKDVDQEPSWEHYMDICLASLKYATHLIVLPKAEVSRGAQREMKEAYKQGKYIAALEDMLK